MVEIEEIDAAEEADNPAQHLVGKTVELQGLKGRPELNGQRGEALSWDTAMGNVHAVRDADTLYLYAHFRVLSDGPDQVVVP